MSQLSEIGLQLSVIFIAFNALMYGATSLILCPTGLTDCKYANMIDELDWLAPGLETADNVNTDNLEVVTGPTSSESTGLIETLFTSITNLISATPVLGAVQSFVGELLQWVPIILNIVKNMVVYALVPLKILGVPEELIRMIGIVIVSIEVFTFFAVVKDLIASITGAAT